MNKNRFTRISFTSLVIAAIAISMTSVAFAEGQNGTTLAATVDMTPHWLITYGWTIDKSVSPETLNLFRGDSRDALYTITVTKDNGTQEAWVDGQICVSNGGVVGTEGLAITAVLQNGYGSPNDFLTSAPVDVSGYPVIPAGGSHCYSYHVNIPITGGEFPQPHAGGTYKVTANVTITNHSGSLGTPKGPSPSATTVFPSPTLINTSINVDDTNGGSWPFSDDGFVTYEKTFSCGEDNTYNNTATIRETGQSDSASVTVNCYELEVNKDASTSFDRTYKWSIDKSADQSSLTLSPGQQYLVNYSIVVDVTGYTDSNWATNGNIQVHNPAPMAATLNSVTDIISGFGGVSVSCGVSFPYPLASDETLNCTYSSSLPDASDRTNTATANLQNYDYDKDGVATADGTTDFSGSANILFSSATITEYDTCIDVSDTMFGDIIGETCVANVPATFTYSHWVGPYAVCGDYTVDNTASFVTKDTEATGSDDWTVDVNVPCAGGCTLTQGYWKTHSDYGPAPYDDTWALLPYGPDTIFFLSGQTWYQVFWTPPAGNAYYNLAHQYMAAMLNILNGADSSSVNATLNQASNLFDVYSPDQVASMKGKTGNATRTIFINLASTLDKFNNGLKGPEHCSE